MARDWSQETDENASEFERWVTKALQQSLIDLRDCVVDIARMQSAATEKGRQRAAFDAHAKLMRQRQAMLGFIEILELDVKDPGLPGSLSGKTN